MMARIRRRKLSSRAKGLLAEASGKESFLLKDYSREDFDAADELVLDLLRPYRLSLLIDVANVRDNDAASWFWKKWNSNFKVESRSEIELLQLRDQLRAIWRDPVSANAEMLINDWLTVHGSQHSQQFRCSIRKSMFLPNPGSLLGMLIQGILEHWKHFKYCTNSQCGTPYFVAKRSDQSVCDSGICKAEKQKEHARKWWREKRSKK